MVLVSGTGGWGDWLVVLVGGTGGWHLWVVLVGRVVLVSGTGGWGGTGGWYWWVLVGGTCGWHWWVVLMGGTGGIGQHPTDMAPNRAWCTAAVGGGTVPAQHIYSTITAQPQHSHSTVTHADADARRVRGRHVAEKQAEIGQHQTYRMFVDRITGTALATRFHVISPHFLLSIATPRASSCAFTHFGRRYKQPPKTNQ